MKPQTLRYTFYVLCLAALDQITKVFFASRDFFVGFMRFHLIKNFGLSFGLNFGPAINLAIIAVAAGLFIYYFYRVRFTWPVVFVIAGAVSNLIDRIRYGYVRDFWDIGLGFTFNLADLFIIVGLLIFLWYSDRPASNQEQIAK